MKQRILVFSIFLFALLSIGNKGWGQSIEIRDAVFTTGTYSKGANITVPIRFNGCFDTLSQTRLYLSNATGDFVNGGTLIGGYAHFFSAFVNGTIPASTPNGAGYKVRVETTNPIKADTSNAFSVGSGFNTIPNLDVALPTSGHTINDSTYGNCLANTNFGGSGLVLTIANVQGATLTATLFDSLWNGTNANINSNQIQVFPVSGNYYTLVVTLTNGSNITTKRSFLLYYNAHKLSFQNDGITEKCFPVTQEFTINILGTDGIRNNYPGTIYKVAWGDGTSTSYSHCQIIGSGGIVTHGYNSSSCGSGPVNTNSGLEYNAFQISLSARNRVCSNFADLNTYLKIFKRPTANFTFTNPACINTSVLFTNTSDFGPAAPSNSQTCNTINVTYNWFVNGSFLPNSTNTNFSTPFSTMGNNTVRLSVENAGTPCKAEITKTICIQPPATVAFRVNNLDSVVGCAPLVVTTTNTTTEGTCIPPTYAWEVLVEATGLAAPVNTYTVSGSITSKTPSFTFNTPGRYLLKLSATNSCGTFTLSRKVIILGITDAALPSAKAYCATPTIINFANNPAHTPNFSSTGNASESYSWSVTGGTSSFVNGTTSSSQFPQIQFNQNVAYTVTLLFTNSCGSKSASQIITFNQPVTANAGADTTICYGLASFPLVGVPTGPSGFSVAWSGGGGSFAPQTSSATTYTVSQNDRNATTATLTYTVTPPVGSVCLPVSDTRIITIRPENRITSIATKTICSGVSVNHVPTSNQTPSTFTWTSSVTTGSVTGNTNGTGTINDILNNASTTTDAVVTYTITPVKDGCNGTPSSFTVTIKPQPNISSTTFINPSSCGGNNGSITLKGLIPNTSFNGSYSKNSGAATNFSGTANGTGDLIITGLTAGTYSNISVSSAPNNCASNIVGPITLSDPSAPNVPTAGSNSPICSGTGNNLNLTANSTTPGVTYNWSGPNSFTSNTQNPTITNVTSAATGTYNVTASLAGCTSAAGSVNVVVTATPVAPVVTTPVEYCQNATAVPLVATATSGNDLQWYTVASGGTASTTVPTPSTTAVGPVIFYVSQKNTSSSCESVRTPISVNIKPTPNITSNTKTDPTQCATSTGSITLSGLTTGQQYVVNFVKGGIAQAAQTITASGGNIIISGLTAGTYTNIAVTLNGCISNTVAGPITLSDPTPPAIPVATSNSPICSGTALSLSATSATAGVTFNWSGPVGFNLTGGSVTRPNTTTPMSGVYSVSATLNNCTSNAATVNVTINQTPATPVASSNSPICSGANLNLTSNSSTSGVTYAWTGPNSFNNATQNPTITAATAAATGLYSVTASNGTCTSLAGTTNVTVKPTPTITGNTKTDPTQCATNTGSITLSGLTAGQQYVVNFVKGGIAQTAQTITAVGGNIVIPALSAGTYTNITVTLDGCISNIIAGPIVLSDPTPPATPVATSNSPICSGITLTLGATSTTPGVTFNWSGPASFNTTGANPTRPNSTVAMAGTYSVSATLNNCTSPAGTVNVVINQTPATPTVTSNAPICSNENLNLTAATSTAGVMTYAWTGPNSFSSTTQNPTINNATTAASGTYNVVATATTGNCASAAGSTTVLVKPTPNIASNSKTDPTNCNTATGTITLTGLVAGTYTVNFTKNGTPQNLPSVIVAANGELVIPNLTAGTYANIQVVLNGCNSNLVVGPITLSDPTPPATPVASSNAPICSGNTLTFTATSATAGVTFNWSGPASFSTTGANATRTNSTVAMSGVYSVTATLNNCTSPAGTVNVVINQTPVTPIVSSNAPICSNATLNLTAATSTAGTITYAWTGPNSFNSIIQNPNISNATTAASGTYSVIATATTGNCASLAGTTTVLVKPTPDITGNTKTDPTACASSTGTITLNGLTSGQSYIVNFVKGGIAQTAQTIQAVNGNVVITSLSAGTYTNITVTLDGCISNIIVGPITLSDPAPPATPVASSNSPICSGNILNLTATSATAGVTFNWSGPASFNTTGATPTRANSTVAMNGVYSVTATLNNCTSAAGSVSVLINQTPAQPTVTTNSPVCTGTTLNLNSSLTPAASVTYAWTGPNGFSSMAKDTTITNVSTAAAGQYSLVVTSVVGTCPSSAGTSTVVVNPTPAIGSTVLKNPINCNTATGSIVLKGLTTGGSYTIRYTNSAGQQTLNNIVAAGDSVKIDNLPSGTYSNIFVILTNCPSNIVGPFTLVDPNPPATPTVTSNTPICSGSTLNLTSSTTTTGAIEYNWTGPNGFTSTNQNPSINNATTAASGTYSVTATLNSCVSAAGTVLVRVDSTPVAPTVSSNAPLCFGSNLNLTATTTFPGTLTYAWTGPNGFTSAAQNPTIPNVSELASGTYSLTITATAGSCSPAAVTRDVIVRPLLTQAVINGLDTVFVCNFNPPANAIQNISANLNAARPFETGKWTIISQPVGATASFANDASANTTITYNRSGLYQLQWAITNDVNCPSTKDTVFLSIVDQPQIKQDLTATAINVCAGNPVTISVPSNQVVGAIRYWQFKRPYTNASWQDTLVTNPTITFNNVQDTFSVRLVVISTNQLKCSNDTAFKEIKINVAPPSLPGVTTGVDTVCQGANSGTVFLTGNIGSPFWQSSTNGINFTNITSNGAVQNYTYNNLTVTTWFRAAVKSGVCDTVFSNATKITVFPPVTIANAGVDVELCGDSTIQLNGNLPSSIETGVWSFASGSPTATIVSPNAANTVVINMVPNTNYRLVWTLSNGICSSTTDQIEIKNYLPLSNTIDTLTETFCNSFVVNVTGYPPVGGNIPYLYQWQILQGGNWVNIPGATNMSYTFTADTTVKIRRQVTAIPCSNTSLEKTIYVQPPLANNTVSGNLQTCINTSPGVLTGSLPTGADGNYFYQWQILQGTNWVDISGAIQKDYTVPVLTVTSQFRRLVTSALCSGNQGIFSTPFEVVVRPDAIANWVITKDTACAPFNINNTIVSPVVLPIQNGSYSWYANNIFYGNNATQNPGFILNNAGDSVTIKMVAVSLYGCKNDSLERKFFTIPPVLTNFTLSDSVGCGPLAVTITNTTPYLGFFNYAWNFGNQQTSNLAQPGTVIYQANPNFTDTTYIVRLTATSECEVVTKTKTVLVKAKPKSIFTPDKTVGCSPLTVNFSNISKGLGATYIWDFGDGTQQAIATQQGVNHTFVTGVQDTFKVKLISINQCGNDTAIYDIVVAPSTLKLDFAVNGTEKQGCKQHTVRFINASNGVSSFQWNFGDGNTLNTTKNIDTITHTFLQSGTFNVTVFATNGCTDTTAKEVIQVFNPPTANFTAAPLSACIGDTIRFTNQSDTVTSLLWNFRDGYTSSVTNPVHAFATAGVFNVQLKAIRQYNSGLACIDSIIRPITIVSKLPGLYTVTDSISNCVPFTATFTNRSLPSSLTVWYFAPGVTDTGNIVTRTFTQVGTYTVKMVAKHPTGCTYEAEKNIVVRAPSGTITYDHNFICGNTPVRFEANVQNTDSIRWNFGDGTFLTTASPVIYHTYNQSGFYVPTATLTTGSLANCSVLIRGLDTIKVDYLKAGFRQSLLQTCGNTRVQFTDTSRRFLPITSWRWSFGDGTFSTQQNPIKNYTASNNWQIQLIVTSASGCSDTITRNIFIKVNTIPSANINAPATACTNRPITYEAQYVSADTVSIVNWSFTNGVVLTGTPVNNFYLNTGTYTATLIVGTLYGCQDTTTKTIAINQSPTITASPDATICKGQSRQLNVTGTTSYSWSPIDGSLSCTTCANPIAKPLTTTQYVVTGTNTFGCTAIDTVVITVAQPIDITVSPNDTICIGQSSQLSVSGATTYTWSPSTTLSNATGQFTVATPILTTRYRVIGFDSYNCFQDTAFVTVAVGQYPTVNLGADKILATGTPLPLVTTTTNGPITRWTWGPSAATLSCTDCPTPIATIKREICYTVEAANLYKCAARDTMCVKVFCENSQVFIPNAFTPDGDGINDVLMVRAQGIRSVKNFRIFNRWGQLVFEKNNFNPNDVSAGWDGRINGKLASPDVYVYMCEVVCENDISYTYKGNVSIVK